jgi:hypothetical protein
MVSFVSTRRRERKGLGETGGSPPGKGSMAEPPIRKGRPLVRVGWKGKTVANVVSVLKVMAERDLAAKPALVLQLRL